MKLTVFANFLNHHQVQVMDQLYNLLGNDFHFVVTLLSDQEYMKGGGDYSNRPYCLCALKDKSTYTEALRLSIESEACVFVANLLSLSRFTHPRFDHCRRLRTRNRLFHQISIFHFRSFNTKINPVEKRLADLA